MLTFKDNKLIIYPSLTERWSLHMKGLTKKVLSGFESDLKNTPNAKLIRNALYKSTIANLSMVGDEMTEQQFLFNVEVKTMKCANQKSSGRCWLFAATNLMREKFGKEKNIPEFEFSQSWLAFWDKLEKCNWYYENIIDTVDLDVDDRVVSYIVGEGVSDGGQWDMFVNIANKYGIVPKSAYPETAQSSATGPLNGQIVASLRKGAALLREMHSKGKTKEQLEEKKEELMSSIYVFLTECYGVPPKKFDFEYKDKDGKYFIEKDYTPLSFYEKYFGDYLNNFGSVINGPTNDKPYDRVYTIDRLGNVVGGNPIKHLNLRIDEMKQAVIAQLKDNQIVWFGCDCGKFGERQEKNLWDDKLYDYDSVTGLDTKLTKAQALDYHASAMNHAMCITGVHLDENGKPQRWKIENSWGSDGVNSGFYMMSDSWFDLYVYQAVVDKKYLGEKAKLYDGEIVHLKPWDPMGTLAD